MRLFNFKNCLLKEDAQMVEATYSVIGYYDGLTVSEIEEKDQKKYLDILSNPYPIMCADHCAGECNYCENCENFNIVGMRSWEYGDNNREKQFWENDELPFLFISRIRFAHPIQRIENVIQKLEESIDILCYLSLESSDLIICYRSNSYREAYKKIEEYHLEFGLEEDNHIQKCFTYLAIRQHTLDQLGDSNMNIKDEMISCSLYGIIKDWNKVRKFTEVLKQKSGVEDWIPYGNLGSDDIMIYTREISIVDLLKLYATDGILVHGAKVYNEAFLNIRSHFMIDRREVYL